MAINKELEKARTLRYRSKPEVKEHYAEKQRERRSKMTLERRREINRKSERKRKLRKYGLTEDSYKELWESQNECCAICFESERGTRDWHIDHCHRTGIVRGILCHHCNLMLGNARDSEDILEAGMHYLQNKGLNG